MGLRASDPARSAQPSAEDAAHPPLITIGGASRSGSTLLTLLLDAPSGYVAVGELRYLWSRGLRDDMLCGCGVPFRSCSFWQDVLARVYGSIDRVPAAELDALQASVGTVWDVPALVTPVRTAAFERRMRRLVEHLGALCAAIREVSGAETIVDSSKLPSYCWLLAEAAGPGSRLFHLTRDSRAVAFSQARRKRKPDIHWTEAYMKRFSPLRSAGDWTGLNLAMEAVGAGAFPMVRARYEDLAADPLPWLDENVPGVPFPESLAERRVVLGVSHTVSGNPLRFESGELTIRADTEWHERMRPRDRRLVTAATAPLLLRYGYL
jgi:sulfotransferase family protein